jgi:hypothetical protein
MTTSQPTLTPPAPTVAPTRPDPVLDDADRERMTHIVLEGFRPKDRENGEFVSTGTNVVEGMVNGTPVQALCGKVWVPGRDPKRYPLCPTCKEIAAGMGWKVPAG